MARSLCWHFLTCLCLWYHSILLHRLQHWFCLPNLALHWFSTGTYLSPTLKPVTINRTVSSSICSPSWSLAFRPSILQQVQNSLARTACKACWSEQITPILARLHWLPMQYWIQYTTDLSPSRRLQCINPATRQMSSCCMNSPEYRDHAASTNWYSDALAFLSTTVPLPTWLHMFGTNYWKLLLYFKNSLSFCNLHNTNHQRPWKSIHNRKQKITAYQSPITKYSVNFKRCKTIHASLDLKSSFMQP